MSAKHGQKGYELEELLRAYFLRAGVYAVRGVPLRLDGDDLTDVDIWLYERPTGSSRRRQIVDAKSKTKPKAVERLFWTKGLYELLGVDGAYIATTDTRPLLNEMSRRLGLSLLDGADIRRMADSDKVLIPNRISEEELQSKIKGFDKSRRNKDTQNAYGDLKAALIDGFGGGTVNRALEHVAGFSCSLVSCYPKSNGADVNLRLLYFAASISAIALDYSLTKVSFKSLEERRKAVLNVIRYGEADESRGLEPVRIATALIERYAANGSAVAQSVFQAIRSDYQKIPAEMIADHILKHVRADGLFRLARSLEFRAFSRDLLGFDDLPTDEKSFLGVLLDFSRIDRFSVAESWVSSVDAKRATEKMEVAVLEDIGPLFDHHKKES
ncbi:hypothetical protein [uncultured Cohaesibacter sp.]|uniref:hypothetical protein n=1 Tax=uncultured Cohaesibacter sp. TaxID=1002546 RepID=UPI002AAB5467|nr:hypothetical protein [uncultured Cohaesibacter sp.]